MKIKLDEKELSQLAIEWAMNMYKTKNVSAIYGIDIEGTKLKDLYIELDVMVDDSGFASPNTVHAEEAIKKFQNLIKYPLAAEADLTPNFDTNDAV